VQYQQFPFFCQEHFGSTFSICEEFRQKNLKKIGLLKLLYNEPLTVSLKTDSATASKKCLKNKKRGSDESISGTLSRILAMTTSSAQDSSPLNRMVMDLTASLPEELECTKCSNKSTKARLSELMYIYKINEGYQCLSAVTTIITTSIAAIITKIINCVHLCVCVCATTIIAHLLNCIRKRTYGRNRNTAE
jgi:hypothetical protein